MYNLGVQARITTTCVMQGVSFVLWSIEVSPRVRELSAVFFSVKLLPVLTNMVDRLANVLQDLARSGELQNAVDLLHRSARGVDGEKDTEH